MVLGWLCFYGIIENRELSEKLSLNAVKMRDKLSSENIYKKWFDIISD